MNTTQKVAKGGCFRGWEYAVRGDYHRKLDLNWAYAPTYLAKMRWVRKWLDMLPRGAAILDAGCGEGVLVDEYRAKGRRIEGLDLNYESETVRRGDILNMPYTDGAFDVVVLLDVIEHVGFTAQRTALKEIWRVLRPSGNLIISIPNLAHLNSRWTLLTAGRLDRTDSVVNHPGERPIRESVNMLLEAGFDIVERKGITLTVPWVHRRLICRHPARLRWLHDFLDRFAVPSLAMIVLYRCLRRE